MPPLNALINCLVHVPINNMGQVGTGRKFSAPVQWTGGNYLIFQALLCIHTCMHAYIHTVERHLSEHVGTGGCSDN